MSLITKASNKNFKFNRKIWLKIISRRRNDQQKVFKFVIWYPTSIKNEEKKQNGFLGLEF